jgi:hypothetical protein
VRSFGKGTESGGAQSCAREEGVKIACKLREFSLDQNEGQPKRFMWHMTWTYDGSGEREVGTLRLRVLDEGEKCFREDDD